MPTKPKILNSNPDPVAVVNAMIDDETSPLPKNMRDAMPRANNSVESVREIGAFLQSQPEYPNAFLNALWNRIGRVVVKSKLYDNPAAVFKGGVLENGESLEEIYVNIANPHQFDPSNDTGDGCEVFKQEIPDVRAVLHILNYEKYYKTTIKYQVLRQAFLSWQGVSDLISRIVDSLYTGANYDEFIAMKYMLSRAIIKGNLKTVTIPEPSGDTAKQFTSAMISYSDSLTFGSPDYNQSGVFNATPKDEQYLIVTPDVNATQDVEVLAYAFNMDKATFMGHKILFDSFAPSAYEEERLKMLFEQDTTYTSYTDEEIALLKTVKAVLVSRDWWMIYDQLLEFDDIHNPQKLYWNYFLHKWSVMSYSPYENAIVFTTGTPAITGVTVTPSAITTSPGTMIQLSASVASNGIISKNVLWEVSGNTSQGTHINSQGLLTVAKDETTESLTVTATSVENTTKKGTSTVTVSAS